MQLGKWIGLLALLLSLYILWQIRQVLLLVFAAVVLATALNRLARRLQKLGIWRTIAVLLSVLIFVGILFIFFLIIVPPFIAQYQELTTTKLPQVGKLLNTWRNQLRTIIPPQLNQYLPDINTLNQQILPDIQSLATRLLNSSFAFFSSSLGALINFLLVIILTLMLLAQPIAYRKAFVRLFPSFYRRRIEGILDRCEEALGRWIVGALISMTVVGVLSVIGLSVLHVQLALAQGVLAGLLNFIPNIGPTLSVVLPMGIALLDAPWKSLAVFILYFVIQQFESNFLTPYVMAQQVALLPAITLLSQVFFATFFGFLGFLLALPLTVVGQVWVQEILIKDVLDKWHLSAEKEAALAAEPLGDQGYERADEPVYIDQTHQTSQTSEQQNKEKPSTDNVTKYLEPEDKD